MMAEAALGNVGSALSNVWDSWVAMGTEELVSRGAYMRQCQRFRSRQAKVESRLQCFEKGEGPWGGISENSFGNEGLSPFIVDGRHAIQFDTGRLRRIYHVRRERTRDRTRYLRYNVAVLVDQPLPQGISV